MHRLFERQAVAAQVRAREAPARHHRAAVPVHSRRHLHRIPTGPDPSGGCRLAVLTFAVPMVRQLDVVRLLPALRSSVGGAGDALRNPGTLALPPGGSTVVSLSYSSASICRPVRSAVLSAPLQGPGARPSCRVSLCLRTWRPSEPVEGPIGGMQPGRAQTRAHDVPVAARNSCPSRADDPRSRRTPSSGHRRLLQRVEAPAPAPFPWRPGRDRGMAVGSAPTAIPRSPATATPSGGSSSGCASQP